MTDVDVSVPADWYPIGADPATRREDALREIAARTEAQPELTEYQDEIADVLVAFGADAEELGALSCAALWEPAPTGPVVANVMVFFVESLGAGDADAELDAITERLVIPTESDIGPRAVERVSLPAGPAARLRFLREAAEEGAPNVVFDQTQFWIPMSHPEPLNLVVSATTPSLHAADRVAEAAEQIAQSVSLSPSG
jgi:hypothetical protein